MDVINTITIPDVWQIVISIISSVGLVYIFEWIKQPKVEITLEPELILNDGRKFLKVRVKTNKNRFGKIFPWQNPVSFAKLKVELVDRCDGNEVVLFKYAAKWDYNPEPLEYLLNGKSKLRPEMLPLVSAPQNFLDGGEDTASVVVKHPGEDCFYAYDGNYYVDLKINKRTDKKIILRLIFSSSSTTGTKEFLLLNSNSSIKSFVLKELQ